MIGDVGGAVIVTSTAFSMLSAGGTAVSTMTEGKASTPMICSVVVFSFKTTVVVLCSVGVVAVDAATGVVFVLVELVDLSFFFLCSLSLLRFGGCGPVSTLKVTLIVELIGALLDGF